MLEINPAKKHELTTIQKLAHDIWPIVYKSIIAEAQIEYMLQFIYQLSALEAQYDDGHQFIIVRKEQVPIGFASYSKKDIDTNAAVFKLHKIYVLPSQQGIGVGQYILGWIVTKIKQQGALALELNVNKENPAIHFYKKMNFVISREEVIPIGSGYVMDDYVMTKVL